MIEKQPNRLVLSRCSFCFWNTPLKRLEVSIYPFISRLVITVLCLFFSLSSTSQGEPHDQYITIKNQLLGKSISDRELDGFITDMTKSPDPITAAYGQLLKGFYLTSKFDTNATQYYEDVEQTARALKDTFLLVDTYIEHAFHVKNIEGARDSSTFIFEKALALSQDINYSLGIIQSSYGLAFHLMDMGNYLKSMEYMQDVRPHVDRLNDPLQTGRLLNNIGHVYMQLNLSNQAIQLFHEFNEAVEKAPDGQVFRLIGMTNLAEAYLKIKEVDKSLSALNRAEEIGKDGFPTAQKTFYYRILGKAYLQKRQYQKAIQTFNKSRNPDGNSEVDQLVSLVGIAEAYQGLGDTLAAHKSLLSAKAIADRIGTIPLIDRVDLNKALAYSFKFTGDPKQALFYSERYNELYRQLHNERLVSDFFLKEIGERLERNRRQAALEKNVLDERIANEKQRNYILSGVLVLFVISLILIALRYRDRNRFAKRLMLVNQEIIRQKEDIEKQANIMKKTNEKISFLNKDLEAQVEKTISELSQKDQIIDKYSFMNSHKLRSPVATIISLTTLFAGADESEKEEIIDFINQEVRRLDKIVYDIQHTLTPVENDN